MYLRLIRIVWQSQHNIIKQLFSNKKQKILSVEFLLERDACPATQLWSCPRGSLSSVSPLATPPIPGDSLWAPPGQITLWLLGAA